MVSDGQGQTRMMGQLWAMSLGARLWARLCQLTLRVTLDQSLSFTGSLGALKVKKR